MSVRLTVYVYTADLERLRRFYAAGLGVEPGAQHGNWLPFELGGATFALHGVSEPDDRDLQRANPGVKPRTLRIGYRLIIPTGGIPSREVRLAMQGNPNRPNVSYHKVRSGDSIWLISRRYGISQSQLRRWNGLSGDVIRPGQRLRVKGR